MGTNFDFRIDFETKDDDVDFQNKEGDKYS